MRKVTYSMGLALAMSLAALATSGAQAAQRPANAQHQQHGMRQAKGGRGGEGLLLRGITLTDAQKQQVKTMRDAQRKELQATRGQKGGKRHARGARPDSATMAARRAEFSKRREQQVTQLRAILTADQRTQFDKNVAELKQRVAQRGQKDGRKAAARPNGFRRGGAR